ncbi:methyltransferase [Microbacterium lacticum]|uniref:methyltransferase n=1 Tax=Microbacterium lacticum TaxID=33885 RepID=UPI0018B0B6F0|nr:methyltransferase [Microbacterium lacticum]MBF9337026.1 methyltransferase [Microbacterium lacticum]
MTANFARLPELMKLANLTTPMSIRVAASLGLADHVAAGVDSAELLAETTATSVEPLGAVIAHLVELGIFSQDEGGHLELTELGELLTDQTPVRAMLDLEGFAGKFDLAMTNLLFTVRTGRPAYEEQYGISYWDDVARDPEIAKTIGRFQPREPLFDADLLTEAVDWSSTTKFLDVGGANGAIAALILRTFPHLTGAVFDLPALAENAVDVLVTTGLDERATAVGGSFFDSVPSGYDTYLLSAIIYDWDDERAIQILSNVAAAAGGARIVVSEVTMRELTAPRDPSLDLQMLTTVSGHERSEGEIIDLAVAAGLRLIGTPHRRGQRFVLEFVPAG